MAVIFTKLTVKNFMSYGNEEVSINLNTHQSTVVSAVNGGGKSSLLLDGVTFALFGKAHRDINKGNLVNSINNKNCLTTIEFTIGKNDFKVIRGLKPNVFEIYKNGDIINQAAAVRDYQKYLETNILKLNFKSFNQVVILGSSSYVPFMQLPTYQRRQVIEDLLDIDIFSKMNQVLKEKISANKAVLSEVEGNLALTREKIDMQQKHIDSIANIAVEQIELKESQIAEWISQGEEIAKEVSSLVESVSDTLVTTEQRRELQESQANINGQILTIHNSMKSLAKETKFYVDNDHCPSCEQAIGTELRSSKVESAKTDALKMSDTLEELKTNANKINEELDKVEAIIEETRTTQGIISTKQAELNIINKNIVKGRDIVENLKSTDSSKTQVLKEEMEKLIALRDTFASEKSKLNETKRYTDVAYDLLKDTGIKTKVIQEYLPVMNKMIAKYLDVMDFFVSFALDENFEETIKSRHRDKFKYSSFSEGEKCKINLALMLTWRNIARLKNSAATNLLILDEIGDANLDATASEAYVKILTGLENTNVFVISHKLSQQVEKFDNVIEIEKHGNFSRIKP